MRALDASKRVRNGLLTIAVTALVVAVGQSFTSVPMLFATPTYYAQFKDAAGINSGDKVQIAGVTVGLVRSTAIDRDTILVGFTLNGRQIGTDSRAAIRTDTILGRRNIEIEPRGSKKLQPNGVLPVGQTTTPYQIYDAFFDVTKAASGWDIDTVKQSLNVLSQTIDQTYPHLTPALRGLQRFSDTIGKRDEEIKPLLANAHKLATVLGDRSGQINQLLVNARTLLAAINERSQTVDYLLQRVDAFEVQVQGLINDNPNLNHVLEQLHIIGDVLNQRKFDLADTLSLVSRFFASLGEGLASGPYFKVMLVNLLPYQILQPFVDAAFKKRGLDPEQFWRSAGLPAFRFPDPNGTRFSNGAPPQAPQPVEGTPDNPGPAVPPGSPCSYTPAADMLPRPGDPLPCARQDQGPYGPVPGGYPPVNVQTSAPNPNGLPPTPGMPIAGEPGATPPDVPGTPAPLPPAPLGARTEQVGPVAGPAPPPGLPPAPLPGPPPPPGPGPQLPPAGTAPLPGNPPYLPPGSQGGTE
jgi:phospholipid/cholesterol/gamma-HCH transport system substrate-binding protein